MATLSSPPPDPRLVSLAVSHWPTAVASAVLVVMILALIARIVSVEQSRFERCGCVAVGLWLGVIALRESMVQSVFAHAGMNLATVRLLAHACAVLGGSALIVLALTWRDKVLLPRAPWIRRIIFAYLPAVLCIAAMAVISRPALLANDPIETHPSIVALYGIVYAAVPIAGSAFSGWVSARAALRQVRVARRSRLIFAVCVFVATTSVIDHSLRIMTAWKTSELVEPELSDALMRRSALTDWMLIVPVAVLLLSLMPVVVASFARRVSSDVDGEKARLVRPLWEHLIAAFPTTRLNRALVLTRSDEELHRHLIEVEDALMLLTQWMTASDLAAQTVSEQYEAVQTALIRHEDEVAPFHSPVVVPWMANESSILELARFEDDSWERRYSLP